MICVQIGSLSGAAHALAATGAAASAQAGAADPGAAVARRLIARAEREAVFASQVVQVLLLQAALACLAALCCGAAGRCLHG